METNIAQLTTTQMKTGVPDYSVQAKVVDEAGIQPETYWLNPKWPVYLGYYKSIPELKQAVDSLATWTAGKGYTTNTTNEVILENISGWGEDSFDSLMQQAVIMKKINGDAYFEIMRNNAGVLINLKPLNPSRMRTVVDPKGLIIRYDEILPVAPAASSVTNTGDKPLFKVVRSFQVNEIFHITNSRVANEIHGTSVIESCQWVIDARNEAMSDLRRTLHRSTVRVLYVDLEDTTKLNTLRTQYKEAIKNGEVLIIPAKQSDAGFQDLVVPPVTAFMEWITYLENFFYQAVGVPKVILGGSSDFTEASSKIGYLTFEQVYASEQRLLEQDIWSQLGIDLTFDRPASLMDNVQSDQAANTGQTNIQPNATAAPMMNPQMQMGGGQ